MSDLVEADVRLALSSVENAQRNLATVEGALERAWARIDRGERIAQTEAGHREEAVRFVLDAVLASIGWRGLNRGRFRALIAAEGHRTPTRGPASVKHAVLLAEASRVLGIEAGAPSLP